MSAAVQELVAAAPIAGKAPSTATAIGQSKGTKGREADRFLELEAYRGIAAVLVISFHCYQHAGAAAAGLYAGTPVQAVLRTMDGALALFFVLSGFINFLPFARAAVDQHNPHSARGFLIRRAIRIAPLYYVALILVWTSRYSGQPNQWLDLVEHLTFTQIFDGTHIFWTIGPAWSLAVEFWFYLLIAYLGPTTFRLCARFESRGTRVAILASITLALAAASILYKLWAAVVAKIPQDNYTVYFSIPARLDDLALGMLLAVILAAHRGGPLLRGCVPALLRIAALALMAFGCYYRLTNPAGALYMQTIWGVAMLLVLASTVLGTRRSIWERVLANRPLQYLGMMSYSVYLWHEPLLIGLDRYLRFTSAHLFFVSTMALIFITLCVASVSYWAIERPTGLLRHLFNRDGRLIVRYPEASGAMSAAAVRGNI